MEMQMRLRKRSNRKVPAFKKRRNKKLWVLEACAEEARNDMQRKHTKDLWDLGRYETKVQQP